MYSTIYVLVIESGAAGWVVSKDICLIKATVEALWNKVTIVHLRRNACMLQQKLLMLMLHIINEMDW